MRRILSVGLLMLSSTLAAQTAPQGCTEPGFRQFDFWIGDWIVESPTGQRQGENRIERILGGCTLQENWIGGGGSVGHSYNTWNRATRTWHQTWVDNSGTLLLLDGAFENGAMVLRGERETPRGRVVERITWRPLEGGIVQQLWETSSDSGRTWTTSFDGRYRRRP